MTQKAVNLVIEFDTTGAATGKATLDGKALTIPLGSVGNLIFTGQTQITSGSELGELEPSSRPSKLYVQFDCNFDPTTGLALVMDSTRQKLVIVPITGV